MPTNRPSIYDRRWLMSELGESAVSFDVIQSRARDEGIPDAALADAIQVAGIKSKTVAGIRYLARQEMAFENLAAAPAPAAPVPAPVAPVPKVTAAASAPTYTNAQMRQRIERIVMSSEAHGKEAAAARLAASAGVTIPQAVAALAIIEKSPFSTAAFIAAATVNGILCSPEARGRENLAMALLHQGLSPEAAEMILVRAARDLPEQRVAQAERAEAETIGRRVAGYANGQRL